MKLPMLHVGFGTQCGPATFFPVWADAPATRGLVTGSEASLSAVELPTPTVNRLSVTSHGTTAALLTEGELLEGGRQHRLVARDVVVGAGETLEIDTLCVQQGRWNGSRDHRHGGRRAPFHIQAGLHSTGPWHGDLRQGEIWQRVQCYEGLRTRSTSASLLDHLDAPAPPGTVDLPHLIDGQRGVIVGFGGQVLSLELFGSHELMRSHYRPMMESMILDVQLFGGNASRQVTAQGARDLVVTIGSNDLARVERRDHRSNGESRPVWLLEGSHPLVSASGVGLGDGTDSNIAHLSAWNTRHGMLAAV